MREERVGICRGGRALEDQADVLGLTEESRQNTGGAGAREGFEVGEDQDCDGSLVGVAGGSGRWGLGKRPIARSLVSRFDGLRKVGGTMKNTPSIRRLSGLRRLAIVIGLGLRLVYPRFSQDSLGFLGVFFRRRANVSSDSRACSPTVEPGSATSLSVLMRFSTDKARSSPDSPKA